MEEAKSVLELNNNGKEEVLTEELHLTAAEEALLQQLMEAGVFYGRSKSRTNPLMRPYILTTRSGFEVIDLYQTINGLRETAKAMEEVLRNKGLILFVGTSPAVRSAIKELAEKLDCPFVTERWLGGTITNFKAISARINQFKKMKEDQASGQWEDYTKKERSKIEKELARLEILFGGLSSLDRLPSLVFVADLRVNQLAAKEARSKNIPVAALVNTDANPLLVDYPIPANDRSSRSVEAVFAYLKEAVKKPENESGG